MKTGIKSADAMTEQPIAVNSSKTLQDCAKLMAQKHVGAVLIKKDKNLVGIITEQDIVRKVVAKGINPAKESVEKYMETLLHTISPDTDIFDALIKMRDANIRHLPILNKGELVGLLTLKDILKIEPQLFELLVDKFELKEEERKPIHRKRAKEGICQICGNYSEEVTEIGNVLYCDECKEEEVLKYK